MRNFERVGMVRRRRKKSGGGRRVTQQWQVEENAAYARASKNLYELTMNNHVSNISWYDSACYEARKLAQKKKCVKIRAIKAGIAKGSKGVSVMNKDVIGPIDVKKTSTLQLHHIFEVSKKHKWMVDTAKSAIKTKLDKHVAERLKIAQRKNRDMHPDIPDLPFAIKNHATRRQAKSWHLTNQELKHLVKTAKPAVDAKLDKHQEADLERSLQTKDLHPEFDFPLAAKNYASRREVTGWDRSAKKLKELCRTASAGTITKLDKHWEARLDEIKAKAKNPDVHPGFPQFPMTIKNHASHNEVAGWEYDWNKLQRLCDTATVQIDSKWDSKNILIPDKFKRPASSQRKKPKRKKRGKGRATAR